ncbi:hypothetical protein GWK47_036142 [Chionoecetes opilio]|uniref:Transforming acidic coiled-coil-containing protein C-terminal domain-containing protein n=1 Tax=Chionoecetes opilio TaxID=41210 RepID=A0A8J4YSQ9_CHIOP|nr:hypothetical protein GWK47_036142 [Chionoecetes opilio]
MLTTATASPEPDLQVVVDPSGASHLLLRLLGGRSLQRCCCCSCCLAEQPRAPEIHHGLDWVFPQGLHGDEVMRKGRVFEDEKKQWTKKLEEQSIALVALEEENTTLKGTVQQMVGFVSKIKGSYDAAEKRHQQRGVQQQREWEARLASAAKDHGQTQEELKKTEASFFELVRKFERLREVSESLQQQKQQLLEEVERVSQEKAECVDKYRTALKTLQETHEKAEEEHRIAKESHEQEMKRASVLIKHAELKILSLTDTVTKKDVEMKRLTSLLEDLTDNMGAQTQ